MSAGLSYRWVRIDVRSSNDHSEVEDVGCGVAGTADIPDDLTLGDGLSVAQPARVTRQVGVVVRDAVGSIDVDLATSE